MHLHRVAKYLSLFSCGWHLFRALFVYQQCRGPRHCEFANPIEKFRSSSSQRSLLTLDVSTFAHANFNITPVFYFASPDNGRGNAQQWPNDPAIAIVSIAIELQSENGRPFWSVEALGKPAPATHKLARSRPVPGQMASIGRVPRLPRPEPPVSWSVSDDLTR